MNWFVSTFFGRMGSYSNPEVSCQINEKFSTSPRTMSWSVKFSFFLNLARHRSTDRKGSEEANKPTTVKERKKARRRKYKDRFRFAKSLYFEFCVCAKNEIHQNCLELKGKACKVFFFVKNSTFKPFNCNYQHYNGQKRISFEKVLFY